MRDPRGATPVPATEPEVPAGQEAVHRSRAIAPISEEEFRVSAAHIPGADPTAAVPVQSRPRADDRRSSPGLSRLAPPLRSRSCRSGIAGSRPSHATACIGEERRIPFAGRRTSTWTNPGPASPNSSGQCGVRWQDHLGDAPCGGIASNFRNSPSPFSEDAYFSGKLQWRIVRMPTAFLSGR